MGGIFDRGQPAFHALGDALGFQPALLQEFVDPFEGLAQALVIDIADDGGQDQAQIGLRRKKIDRIHH
jgi:hypothetical protein